MISLKDLKNAFLVSLWFVFLTFPLMVIKVNPFERTVGWRWENMGYVAVGSFISLPGQPFFPGKQGGKTEKTETAGYPGQTQNRLAAAALK